MNVSTMVISGEEAARKARIYSSIPENKRTPEDEYLLRVYHAGRSPAAQTRLLLLGL